MSVQTKIRSIILSICLLFVVGFLNTFAQNPKYLPPQFQNVSLKEGLSNLSIHSITQDNLGYIWIGTARGLNRYDGIQFNHYFYNKKDSSSLYHDNIQLLYTNFDGKVFIATTRGINLYDPIKEKMKRTLPFRLQASSLLCYNNTTYAISVQGILYQYNEKTNSFEPVNDLPNDIELDRANIDKQGNIWAKNRNNDFLIRYNLTNKLYEKYFLPRETAFTRHDYLTLIGNQILIISPQKSYQFNTDTKKFTSLSPKYKQLKNLKSNDINFIKEIAKEKIWIGTKKNGLFILDENTSKLIEYNSHTSYRSLSSDHVMSIFNDRNNNVWLGTFDRGMEVAFNRRKNFNFDISLNQLIGRIFITGISSDYKGTYYFGTRFNGILIYNSLNRSSKTLNMDNSFLTENHIRSLFISSNNKLWVSTETNSFIVDLKNGISQQIEIPEPNNGLVCFYETNNLIYAGSDQTGLLKYRLNGEFIGYINDYGNNITQLTQLNDSCLLFSSFGKGLYVYHTVNDSVQHISHHMKLSGIIDDQIITLFTDSNNQIWAGGFVHGLFKINFSKDTISTYTMDEGLPSNDITGITEDKFGYLWISTAYGLSKFDKNNSFTNYSYNEGLDFIQFHQKAALRDERGTIFFGGNFGLAYFNPEVLSFDHSESPSIILDRLNIGNQAITPNDESQVLEKTLAKTQAITLSHRHSIFSIDYKGFDYVSAKNLKYAYYLEGFDDEWNYVDNHTRASYTNLNPDDYIFHVKAQNNHGEWSKKPASLKIKVKPAPWLTVWAMMGYMLAVGLIILMAFQISLKASIIKRELKIEHKERLREKEMSDMKLRFFTNISHELRTPLTLIKGNVDYLTRETKGMNLRLNSIKSLQNSTDRLLRLVNQILSFRQLENDALDLKIKQEEIITISKELIDSFKYNCQFKQVQLSLDTNITNLILPLDRDKYEKILFNLLNNSLKFSEKEGNIIIAINLITNKEAGTEYDLQSISESYIQILVIDDGKGISKEKLPYVFDRYTHFNDNAYRQDYSGSGIGLNFTKRLVELHHGKIIVTSTPAVCTKFSFALPVDIAAYNQEVIIDSIEHQINKEPDKLNYAAELLDEVPVDNDKKTILLAEDDIELNQFITHTLSSHFKVINTFNGLEALKLIKNQMPDIIISDVMMPKMDGMELCKTVKNDQLISHIPLILLTAKSDIENKLIGYQFGADEYITKPFEIKVLQARIQNLIKQRKKLQEFYQKALPVNINNNNTNQIEINFMNQVNSVIEENYKNPEFNVHQMAEKMFMSRTSFYRKFMNITDISPKEYLNKFRINKSTELIQEGQESLGEISFICGFNNQSIFSVTFKKEIGITPLQFRKSL